MKINPKKCKGINKANGVKGCGKLTLYRKYGLCSKCLTTFYTTTDAGKLLVLKAYNKAVKPRREFEKAQSEKKQKSEIKRLKIQAEKWVHKYIRERDKYKPCISELTEWNKDHQAGHLYPKGKYEGLRYDYDNINGQSIQGNIFKEGNVQDYRINLIQRIGLERVRELDKKAAFWKANIKRWEVDELKMIIEKAKLDFKNLDNENNINTSKRKK